MATDGHSCSSHRPFMLMQRSLVVAGSRRDRRPRDGHRARAAAWCVARRSPCHRPTMPALCMQVLTTAPLRIPTGAWLEGAHATARRRLNRTRDAFGPGTAIATSDPKTSWAKQQVRQWSWTASWIASWIASDGIRVHHECLACRNQLQSALHKLPDDHGLRPMALRLRLIASLIRSNYRAHSNCSSRPSRQPLTNPTGAAAAAAAAASTRPERQQRHVRARRPV